LEEWLKRICIDGKNMDWLAYVEVFKVLLKLCIILPIIGEDNAQDNAQDNGGHLWKNINHHIRLPTKCYHM
jgi:ubiquitin-protein ligase